jgi:hypothetical protein
MILEAVPVLEQQQARLAALEPWARGAQGGALPQLRSSFEPPGGAALLPGSPSSAAVVLAPVGAASAAALSALPLAPQDLCSPAIALDHPAAALATLSALGLPRGTPTRLSELRRESGDESCPLPTSF